jgi:hypothetical protein
MIDEVQELAARKEDKLVSALRLAITKKQGFGARDFHGFLTGGTERTLCKSPRSTL